MVQGSAGPNGATSASDQLKTCSEPVAVVALMENPRGYVGIGRGGLPDSPLPLVRVIMQQSGCFRIVDRYTGLNATVKEQELKEAGVLRADDTTVQRGRGIVAQYTLIPSLTFSEQDAGRQIGGSDHRPCLDNVQTVGKAGTFEIAVDQRRYDPDLGKAEPGGDKIGCIFHEQGDRVTRLIALRQRPVGNRVGAGFKFAIGHPVAFEIKGDIVRKTVDRDFDIVGDQDRCVGINILDLRHHIFQRTGELYLALDHAEYTQGFSPHILVECDS